MTDRIDTAQWRRLGELFDKAIGLDAADRDAMLQAIEREDADLAQALASLLAADARHHAHTSEQRDRVLQGSLAAIDASGASVGDRVGPYVLREELGRGGMGVVFRADRADGQVRQEVALKIVRRAMLDASGRERFLREREIVAAFQHPSIARMLDVGQTADGSPYLAMELVHGVPVTDFCDARKLGARARVEVFLRVCDAVQHAHANLVLHRDLKPSNVLVGDDGLPKLIDFGIAKPLTLLAGDEHEETATAHRFFSPSNVAPEQLRGERVGVACDVYQLGTLLHELLCGATVFDAAGLTAGQLEQKILAEAPEAPSLRAARAPEAVAIAHGAATPEALARDLRGDLDAIVARALRKLPRERYGSVEQLADELRRYLDGRPVAALRGRRWYRARKFMRRHALALGLSTAAIALVATFVALLWMQSQRVARERDLAQKERDHAEHVAQFLTDVFKAADPAESLSRDQPIGTVLDNARKRMSGQLGQEPGQRVRMLGVLAGVYTSLDDRDTATSLLDDAQRIIEKAPSIDPRIELAYDLQRARLMEDRGDRKAEAVFAKRALALQRKLGDRPGQQWEARVLIAQASALEDPGVAYRAMESLLGELAHDPDIPPIEFAKKQMQLGHGLAIVDETKKAGILLRGGLKTLEARLPSDHPDVLEGRRLLADLLIWNLGRSADAVPLLKDVIARQRRLYGERSSSVAKSLVTLSQAYTGTERPDDAIAAAASACDILHRVHTRPHLDLMGCSSALGDLYRNAGKPELAAANYIEAVRISTAVEGKGSSNALVLRSSIAEMRVQQGRLDEAERLFAELYRDLDLHSDNQAALGLPYAQLLHRLHRDAEAIAVLDRVEPALQRREKIQPEEMAEGAQLRKAIVAVK